MGLHSLSIGTDSVIYGGCVQLASGTSSSMTACVQCAAIRLCVGLFIMQDSLRYLA